MALRPQHITRLWPLSLQGILGAVVAFTICVAPHNAASQVFEITSTGDVVMHNGPEVLIAGSPAPRPLNRGQAAPLHNHGSHSDREAGEIAEASGQAGLSPALISAVAWQESRFDSAARSPKGAIGVMQLMPSTARALGVEATDPRENLSGGARYLSGLLRQFNGDLPLALAAYNAGPASVMRYGRIPPYRETRNYVDAILEHLAEAVSQPANRE